MVEKAVISGSSGFIGKHLAAALQAQNIEIVPLPRNYLTNINLLAQFIQAQNPEYIFHLATAGNIYGKDSDMEVFTANVIGTMNLIMAAHPLPYKAFINFSSSSVLLPTKTMYSETKALGERHVALEAQFNHKPILSIRPATVIGLGEPQEHLIPQLIHSCLRGNEIPFVPTPTHDYINVSDVVSAAITLATMADKYKGESFNVSTGKSLTNEKVKETVEWVLGKTAKTWHLAALREYDSTNWQVDNMPLLKIGWRPLVTLEESIKQMVDAFEPPAPNA